MSNFLNLPKNNAGAVAGGAAAGAVAGGAVGDRAANRRENAGDRQGNRQDNAGNRQENRQGNVSDRQANRQDNAAGRVENRGEWKNNREQIRNDYRQNREQVADRRHDRADNIRDHVNDRYFHPGGHWHNWWGSCWGHHPGWAWWNVTRPARWAAYGSLAAWCGGGTYYTEPVYYDYGYSSTGEDLVYVDGEPEADVYEYADSAYELADAGAETIEAAEANNTAAEMEWLPLGVYAMTDEEDGDPVMFVQLAVAKDSTIAGTYYNAVTEEETSVTGSVDNETQRAAFSVGDGGTVVETGIYNLTQDETTALVHFEDGDSQTWFMARLPDPETADAQPADSGNASSATVRPGNS